MIRAHLNFKYIDPFHSEMDSVIEAWYSRLNRQKSRNRGIKGDVSWIEIDFIEVDTFLLVMGKDNGDVEYFSPKIKVADGDVDNSVPEGLPNSIKPPVMSEWDGEGELEDFEPIELEPARQKTWMEWLVNLDADGNASNYAPTVVEGYHYFFSIYPLGKSMSGKDLLTIHNSGDAELVDSAPIKEESELI